MRDKADYAAEVAGKLAEIDRALAADERMHAGRAVAAAGGGAGRRAAAAGASIGGDRQ